MRRWGRSSHGEPRRPKASRSAPVLGPPNRTGSMPGLPASRAGAPLRRPSGQGDGRRGRVLRREPRDGRDAARGCRRECRRMRAHDSAVARRARCARARSGSLTSSPGDRRDARRPGHGAPGRLLRGLGGDRAPVLDGCAEIFPRRPPDGGCGADRCRGDASALRRGSRRRAQRRGRRGGRVPASGPSVPDWSSRHVHFPRVEARRLAPSGVKDSGAQRP
jgi:hypothetical protein